MRNWPAPLLAATLPLLLGTAALAQTGSKDVTIVLGEQLDVVEPCMATRSNIGRVVLKNIAEPLTEIDPADGSVTPRLATEWEQVDEDTWRFHLQEGVQFHDGAPFDAEAVKASIERTLDPALSCEMAYKFFGGIELTVEPVDAHTVDITANPAQPIMPTMMGVMAIVSPNTPRNEFTRQPIGTGPYRFAEWNVGQNIVVERFDDYWGETPEVEKATYVFRSESPVRAAMVAAGEADIAPTIAAQDATDEGMDFSYPNSETTHIRIDTQLPPLSDRRVREALNLAVDREGLIGSIFSKDVEMATQLVGSGINGFNPNLEPWPYDPERAMELIAAAKADGVPVDRQIRLIGRLDIYPSSTESMEAFLAMFQSIGLNVDLQMVEVAQYSDLQTKPFDPDRPPTLLQGMHDNNNGDAVFTVFNKYHSEGLQSAAGNEELDRLIEKAQAATGDERRELWQEVFRMIHEDVIADVEMFHMVGYTRVSPRIEFTPSIATNSELELAEIRFRE
jgi:peptide/nickel transport system substrate-binding protein